MLRTFVTISLAVAAAAAVPDFGPTFNATTRPNMNGEPILSATPGAKPELFPKNFRDYPGGVEAFDVYSPPMTTLYSQVTVPGVSPCHHLYFRFTLQPSV